MSTQKDLIAGLDLSPLSSASQEDIMQAINGLAPLTNIGLVFVGTARPDITNNPRMIRYIWLDISDPTNPSFKRYIADRTALADADASWESLGVANGAILTAMMAARSITGGINVGLLKLNSDYSASLGSIYYVLRVAANGKDIEAVSINTAIDDGGGIGLSLIDLAGSGAQKYLKIVAGALTYDYIDPADDITAAFNNRIPVETAIAPGTTRYVLRTNVAADAAEWVAPTGIFSGGELPIASLAQELAVANDLIRWNGTEWARVFPSLEFVAGSIINFGVSLGTLDTLNASAAVNRYAHTFTQTPKIFRATIKNISGGVATATAHPANYEIPVELVLHNAGNDPQYFGLTADPTYVAVSCREAAGANAKVLPYAGGAGYAALTAAEWQLRVYAWK